MQAADDGLLKAVEVWSRERVFVETGGVGWRGAWERGGMGCEAKERERKWEGREREREGERERERERERVGDGGGGGGRDKQIEI